MKHLSILWLAMAMAAAPLMAQNAWIRQTDLGTGLNYDIPLGPNGGAFASTMPVPKEGTLLELFARGTAWDSAVYLLDSKIVQAYTPAVTVALATEDPYVRGDATTGNYVRRTRADRPFSLRITVSGLVAGSSSPAENSLYFCQKNCSYDPLTYSGLGKTPALAYEANLSNGITAVGPVYHELTGTALTKACGEQSYTFVRYAADNLPDTILAQPKLEVWPVASAAVTNLTAGTVYIDRLPPINIELSNLYPDSRTYTQIYRGPAALGTAGTVVGGTECRFGRFYNPTQAEAPTNVPQNQSIAVTDLSNYTPTDGIYTLEVWTETPFFNRVPERLRTITFEVDRVITSRGQLNSAEKAGP
ncbi:MAG: hypothetical protein EOP86_01345 [Verrucomicrobiaceae bacterium]|nr:MAG: hypothetical protein EOP86_01345 [Verrucomicrobiaceae bacterium]